MPSEQPVSKAADNASTSSGRFHLSSPQRAMLPPLLEQFVVCPQSTCTVTGAVHYAAYARTMQTDAARLRPGSHIFCPHCRHWHAVYHGHIEGTDYTLQMLYFTCRGLRFYAGQAGYPSQHQIRPVPVLTRAEPPA